MAKKSATKNKNKVHHSPKSCMKTDSMAKKSVTIQQAIHRYLASIGIKTVDEFFGVDKRKIKRQLWNVRREIGSHFVRANRGAEMDELEDDWCCFKQPEMMGLIRAGRVEAYRPLITAILAEESTSDEELCRLINQEFHRPPTPLRLISSSTTSSLVDPSSELDESLPPLRQDFADSIYTNVPGLVEHFINKQLIDPAFRLTPDKSFVDQKSREVLTDTSPTSMLNWITSIFHQLELQTQNIRDSRTWRTLVNTRLEDVNGTWEVDGAIMSRVIKNERKYHIRDVLVPFELEDDTSLATEAIINLGKYVVEVFKAQPTRSFVIGITLCGTSMQLWQFDRSGAIGSGLVDINASTKNLEKFFALMLCFLKCDKQLLGFDPTFIEAEGRPTVIRIKNENVDQELEIDRLNYQALEFCGRGTTCWEAHLSGDKSQRFLIKDSWQPEHQRSEGAMLCEITKKNIPHVARYHHHQDVRVDGQIVDIESYVRRGVNFQICQKIAITEESDDDREVKNEFNNRVHRRLILKDVGKPIWTVNSPVRLLEALEGCIKGHQALLNAGILHRDISINNLMVDNQTEDPDRKSFLIDLDMAIPYPMRKDDDLQAQMGTKIFMSRSLLLKENSHTHVDDLESFFWVLVWICIHYPVDQSGPSSNLENWYSQAARDLGAIKKFYISPLHLLTDHFKPLYKKSVPLLKCVAQFAEIISDPLVRKIPVNSLYNQILETLQLAQEKLREEEELDQS
ncbi:hypothetical protein PSTG_09548 [Puccinia striiformis f. sp. tritici PST-78]|uniref:Protein kinase domain-containing protein n=1 Tax=Puccinia striiformis f. sp. tritici PST-78 TaxID=1165861 RepID=A0A0L0VCU8_9BASI|nr:hypothetical protein PSTG_09548 [Puccinia striiformis f. sp. tritici PST-78]